MVQNSKFIYFDLVDYTFVKRTKPYQNLSLLIFGTLWMIIFPLSYFNNDTTLTISKFLMILSIIPFLLFVILSLIFLYRKTIGNVKIDKTFIEINEKQFSLNFITIQLNINQSDLDDSNKNITQIINQLPFWGNYIIINIGSKQEIKTEFTPTNELLKIMDDIQIIGYKKRNLLAKKTSELFKDIMSILWAAS